MSSQAQHFAETVLAAFESAGAVTDVDIAQAGGPSSTTMTKIRKAAAGEPMTEPRNDTYRRIEAVAGWAAGAARALWRYGDVPFATLPSDRAAAAGRLHRLPQSPLEFGDDDERMLSIENQIAHLRSQLDALERQRADADYQIRSLRIELDVVLQERAELAHSRRVEKDAEPEERTAALPKAARKSSSAGRALRRQQDEDAESVQD